MKNNLLSTLCVFFLQVAVPLYAVNYELPLYMKANLKKTTYPAKATEPDIPIYKASPDCVSDNSGLSSKLSVRDFLQSKEADNSEVAVSGFPPLIKISTPEITYNAYSTDLESNEATNSDFAGDTYTVSVSATPAEGGSLSGNGTYNYGNMVTLNATPKNGYSFANWTENGVVVSTNSTYTFSINSNRNLVARFTPFTFNVLISAIPSEGGTLSGGGIYDYGSTVTLNATPRAGYIFVNWIENGIAVSTNSIFSFKVNSSRTLFANFISNSFSGIILATAIPTAGGTADGGGTYNYGSVATLTATSNTGYNFSSWTENGTIASISPEFSFTVGGNRNLQANFSITSHSVSVTSSPTVGGTASGSGTYIFGSVINLNATPNTGYRFVNWTENGTEVSNNSTYYVKLDSNRNLVANFTPDTYNILISSAPPAGGVVSGGGTYEYGSVVTLSAKTNKGYSFTGWTEDGTLVSKDSTYSFVVKKNRTVLANLEPEMHTISVTASPAEGGSVSGGGTYGYGSMLTLYIIPMNGYHFVNWTENGSEISTSSTYSFTVNADRTLVANYKLDTYIISAFSSPSVTGLVSGGNTYGYGSLATLTAANRKGYIFINWTEGGTIVSTDSIYSFIVERNRTITANYFVNVQTVAAIASPAEGGFISGGGTYNFGSVVTLNATPHIGFNFINWTENDTQVSTSSVFSISVDTDRTLVANFSHNTSNNGIILASVSPAAGGTVSGSNSYDFGSIATVKAIANTGYCFSNWTEGGTVVSTDSIYSFTVERSRNLVAVYTINTHIISITASTADGGFFSGSGTYNYGSTAFLNATPYIGYRFVNWTENGVSISANSAYSFTVESNRTLAANFTLLVGLQENISQEIRMYPNPANNNLHFEYAFPEKAEIKIYNNTGQLVLTSFEKAINISHLAIGTYVVKVNEQVLKLVKL